MRIHNIVEETIAVLENPVSYYEIDGIIIRLDYVVRTLVNLDSGFSQTDEIVRLLGEAIANLQILRSASEETSCHAAFEHPPKILSGNRGRPSFGWTTINIKIKISGDGLSYAQVITLFQ